jgi:hypothetical protein
MTLAVEEPAGQLKRLLDNCAFACADNGQYEFYFPAKEAREFQKFLNANYLNKDGLTHTFASLADPHKDTIEYRAVTIAPDQWKSRPGKEEFEKVLAPWMLEHRRQTPDSTTHRWSNQKDAAEIAESLGYHYDLSAAPEKKTRQRN